MVSFFPDENDSFLKNIAMGALIGGVGYSGVQGISMIRDYLTDLIYKKPSIYKDLNEKVLTFEPPIEKKSALDSPLWKEIGSKYAWGFGLPLGVYGTHKLFEFLNDKEEEYKVRGKLKELEKSYISKEENEPSYKKAFVNGFCKAASMEIKKIAQEKKEPGLLDKTWGAIKDTGEAALDIGEIVKAIAYDIPRYGLPIIYGGLGGAGLITGYQAAKNYLDPAVSDPSSYDILGNPTLIPVYDKKKSKPVEKKAEQSLDKLKAEQIPSSNGVPGLGMISNIGKGIWNSLRGPYDMYKNIEHASTEAKNIMRGPGWKMIREFSKDPYGATAKTLASPKGIGTLLGAGTIMGLPSMLLTHLAKGQAGPAPQVPNLTQNSLANKMHLDRFKRFN